MFHILRQNISFISSLKAAQSHTSGIVRCFSSHEDVRRDQSSRVAQSNHRTGCESSIDTCQLTRLTAVHQNNCIPLVMTACTVHYPRHYHRLHDIPGAGDEEERHIFHLRCNTRFLHQQDDISNGTKGNPKHEENISVVQSTTCIACRQAEHTCYHIQRDAVDLR